jgi:hypothetical protein
MQDPNIPHHYERRPGDYPKHQAPKYGWRDDNGMPIHAIDKNGTRSAADAATTRKPHAATPATS